MKLLLLSVLCLCGLVLCAFAQNAPTKHDADDRLNLYRGKEMFSGLTKREESRLLISSAQRDIAKAREKNALYENTYERQIQQQANQAAYQSRAAGAQSVPSLGAAIYKADEAEALARLADVAARLEDAQFSQESVGQALEAAEKDIGVKQRRMQELAQERNRVGNQMYELDNSRKINKNREEKLDRERKNAQMRSEVDAREKSAVGSAKFAADTTHEDATQKETTSNLQHRESEQQRNLDRYQANMDQAQRASKESNSNQFKETLQRDESRAQALRREIRESQTQILALKEQRATVVNQRNIDESSLDSAKRKLTTEEMRARQAERALDENRLKLTQEESRESQISRKLETDRQDISRARMQEDRLENKKSDLREQLRDQQEVKITTEATLSDDKRRMSEAERKVNDEARKMQHDSQSIDSDNASIARRQEKLKSEGREHSQTDQVLKETVDTSRKSRWNDRRDRAMKSDAQLTAGNPGPAGELPPVFQNPGSLMLKQDQRRTTQEAQLPEGVLREKSMQSVTDQSVTRMQLDSDRERKGEAYREYRSASSELATEQSMLKDASRRESTDVSTLGKVRGKIQADEEALNKARTEEGEVKAKLAAEERDETRLQRERRTLRSDVQVNDRKVQRESTTVNEVGAAKARAAARKEKLETRVEDIDDAKLKQLDTRISDLEQGIERKQRELTELDNSEQRAKGRVAVDEQAARRIQQDEVKYQQRERADATRVRSERAAADRREMKRGDARADARAGEIEVRQLAESEESNKAEAGSAQLREQTARGDAADAQHQAEKLRGDRQVLRRESRDAQKQVWRDQAAVASTGTRLSEEQKEIDKDARSAERKQIDAEIDAVKYTTEKGEALDRKIYAAEQSAAQTHAEVQAVQAHGHAQALLNEIHGLEEQAMMKLRRAHMLAMEARQDDANALGQVPPPLK